jgi:hypothetical protein
MFDRARAATGRAVRLGRHRLGNPAEAAASVLGFGDSDSISWSVMLQEVDANQALERGAWN